MESVFEVWWLGAFVVVLVLVIRDARSRQNQKPQRDRAAVDLQRYESARRVGAAAALTLSGSVVVELLSFTVSPTAAALLHDLARLIAYMSFLPLLLWVHRVAVNARVLGCAGVPTATKAVTWFFVPIASVFMPYRSVADFASAIRGPGRMVAVWRVALWWLPFVATLASRFLKWSVASTVFSAIAALAAWSMVVAIDQGQGRMFRKAKKKKKPSARELVHAA